MSLYKNLLESRDYLKSKTKLTPKIGIVLGSGLGAFANDLEVDASIPFSEIPHYQKPTVAGHGGRVIFGTLKGIPLVCQQGRVHYYEGHAMTSVVHPVRTLGLLGAKSVILTNAAGGLGAGLAVGDLMVIRDHINLMGTNPLIGPNIDQLGTRFPDMTKVYSSNTRSELKSIYQKLGLRHSEGVYAGLSGPTYETPAEVEYLRKLGIDAVGMSTVPEAIALRQMGIEVTGISCITNLAAGMSGTELSHAEVTETGKRVEKTFSTVLSELIQRMA